MNIPTLAGVVAALAGAVVAYFVALRRLSGSIKHSEAEQLWLESKAIREDLQERNEFLAGRLERCEGRITTLEQRIDFLADANATLREQNMILRNQAGAA